MITPRTQSILRSCFFIFLLALDLFLLTSPAWAAESSSVIAAIRHRAAEVIEHYKPVAYIMGGFGLVGLAWGAIFGKLNWKWFANLAIGLFLIAWMGHLIDYFTRDRGARNVSTQFQYTTSDIDFGDTIAKKDTAETGKIVSLYIDGENFAVDKSVLDEGLSQVDAAYIDQDYQERNAFHKRVYDLTSDYMRNTDSDKATRAMINVDLSHTDSTQNGQSLRWIYDLSGDELETNVMANDEIYTQTGKIMTNSSSFWLPGDSYDAIGDMVYLTHQGGRADFMGDSIGSELEVLTTTGDDFSDVFIPTGY